MKRQSFYPQVGADQFILVSSSERADVRMEIFNADGFFQVIFGFQVGQYSL
jgi:diaminopimelate epimerase